jgi:hypothetical protein
MIVALVSDAAAPNNPPPRRHNDAWKRRIAAIQNDAVHRSERSCRMPVTAEHNVSPGHAQAGELMPIADSVALTVGPGAFAHTAQE